MAHCAAYKGHERLPTPPTAHSQSAGKESRRWRRRELSKDVEGVKGKYEDRRTEVELLLHKKNQDVKGARGGGK